MIRRILVGLTGTPYTPVAIQRARELAKRHDALVTGIAVSNRIAAANVAPLSMVSLVDAERLRAERITTIEQRIDKAVADFEQAFEGSGLRTDVVRTQSNPVEALCRHWRYHDALVLGLRGLFEYGVLDEPRDALMKLIGAGVRPIIAVSSRYREINRVLIAYSGSMESAKTMKRFVQLRLWPDAAVRIVHFSENTERAAKLLSNAHDYCRDWGMETETDAPPGTADKRLLPYAEDWSADMIVLGDSACSVLERRLFGCTVEHVIRNAPIPLFLAH